jgi:hypothetical protein
MGYLQLKSNKSTESVPVKNERNYKTAVFIGISAIIIFFLKYIDSAFDVERGLENQTAPRKARQLVFKSEV